MHQFVALACLALVASVAYAQVRIGGPPTAPNPAAQKQSVIKLRNGCTLVVNSSHTDEAPEDQHFLTDLYSTLGLNHAGAQRAQYVSAYADPTTGQLKDGRNVLQSAVSIEANNTLILVNVTHTPLNYSAVDLSLVENNTLALQRTSVTLDSSSLRFARNNWLLSNASTLKLNNSVLNLTNFFTWYEDRSTFLAYTSTVFLQNVLTWWQGSTVKIDNASFNVSSGSFTAPQGFGSIHPVFFVNDTGVNASSTDWFVDGVHLVQISNSDFDLYNTTLTFKDSVVHFVQDNLDFTQSTVVCDNSTIVLYANALTKRNVVAVQNPADFSNITAADPLVGLPLGKVDTVLTSTPGQDIDISLSSDT